MESEAGGWFSCDYGVGAVAICKAARECRQALKLQLETGFRRMAAGSSGRISGLWSRRRIPSLLALCPLESRSLGQRYGRVAPEGCKERICADFS